MADRTIQEIIFELMERSSFNEFDGVRVVRDLKSSPALWEGVIMDRESFDKSVDLTKLRDIPGNLYNVDTVFIIPKKGKENKLHNLAKKWKADEINWIGGKTACELLGDGSDEIRANSKAILEVWWD